MRKTIFAANGESGYSQYNGSYIWIGEDILIQFSDKIPFDNGKRKLKVKMNENSIKIEGLGHDLTDFEDRCGV